MEIIPAIIPKSFEDLQSKSARVKSLVSWVQVDVVDGNFVPSVSWPFESEHDLSNFKHLLSGDETLPYADVLKYEVDLMVKNPEDRLDEWIQAGFSRLIVHIESTHNLGEILERIDGRVEFGLALNVDTPNEMIYPYMDKIDFVQCMGIEHIGYQGEPFDDRVIHKITDFKEKYPDAIISVDGGVNLDSAPHLFKAGADRLVSGSTIFGSEDTALAIEKLKQK